MGDKVEPGLDLGSFGGILISGQLDAGLDFTERRRRQMKFRIFGRLKPGDHTAMRARLASLAVAARERIAQVR